jgi:hypothetical protein
MTALRQGRPAGAAAEQKTAAATRPFDMEIPVFAQSIFWVGWLVYSVVSNLVYK